jgi:zinc protease
LLPIALAGLLGALAAPAAGAGPAPAKATAPLTLPKVETWTLENGLTVFYLGVHDAPVVTVQVYYHVGSKDEPRDRRGSAHMFEHMMFKGTTHVPPEEHARMLDKLGGSSNAFTQWDVTGYHATVPRQYLDFAVQLEAERMRQLVFRPEMVDREREVVKEEKRMRVDNNPLGRAVETFFQMAFLKHPYAWTAAGFIEDLDALTPDDLKTFYDRYYQPNNAALIIVGDVSADEARAAAEKHFAPIPRGKAPPRPADAAAEPAQTQTRRDVAERPAQVGIVIVGFHIPEAKHPDMAALQVAASILADGESSRLYKRIVRKDKIGVAAAGQVLALEHPGLFFVYGAHLDGEQSAKVEKALLDEVARLGTTAVPARELEKAKNQLSARFVFGLESVEGLAERIGMSWITHGDGTAWLGELARLQAVGAADVQRVAKKYLVASNMTVLVVPVGGQP